MKVEIKVEIDIEEMLKASNRSLQKLLDNQIHKDYSLGQAITETMKQNNHLLKIINEEKGN